MPFRPVDVHVSFGKPQVLVEAGDGDVSIQVSCSTFGASGVASGPNYIVGVLDDADDAMVRGIYVTANEWSSDLDPGDKLWVVPAEDLTFTTSIHITGLVRTAPSPAKRKPGAKSDD